MLSLPKLSQMWCFATKRLLVKYLCAAVNLCQNWLDGHWSAVFIEAAVFSQMNTLPVEDLPWCLCCRTQGLERYNQQNIRPYKSLFLRHKIEKGGRAVYPGPRKTPTIKYQVLQPCWQFMSELAGWSLACCLQRSIPTTSHHNHPSTTCIRTFIWERKIAQNWLDGCLRATFKEGASDMDSLPVGGCSISTCDFDSIHIFIWNRKSAQLNKTACTEPCPIF